MPNDRPTSDGSSGVLVEEYEAEPTGPGPVGSGRFVDLGPQLVGLRDRYPEDVLFRDLAAWSQTPHYVVEVGTGLLGNVTDEGFVVVPMAGAPVLFVRRDLAQRAADLTGGHVRSVGLWL